MRIAVRGWGGIRGREIMNSALAEAETEIFVTLAGRLIWK